MSAPPPRIRPDPPKSSTQICPNLAPGFAQIHVPGFAQILSGICPNPSAWICPNLAPGFAQIHRLRFAQIRFLCRTRSPELAPIRVPGFGQICPDLPGFAQISTASAQVLSSGRILSQPSGNPRSTWICSDWPGLVPLVRIASFCELSKIHQDAGEPRSPVGGGGITGI